MTGVRINALGSKRDGAHAKTSDTSGRCTYTAECASDVLRLFLETLLAALPLRYPLVRTLVSSCDLHPPQGHIRYDSAQGMVAEGNTLVVAQQQKTQGSIGAGPQEQHGRLHKKDAFIHLPTKPTRKKRGRPEEAVSQAPLMAYNGSTEGAR
ncbi:hypothetical protein NDU88_005485 [Pleurodeles waltl]|uniref:Uncharacterized protein n=1 Tax=Pleurodeles waltl TaxID=8319 RepID=A0AAV7TAU8_PLEWA|nr:hypothetical protein NDU88_005485 [Pleurodeles waltl]